MIQTRLLNNGGLINEKFQSPVIIIQLEKVSMAI